MGKVPQTLVDDIKGIIADIAECEPEEVGLDANFYSDLGIDSIKAIEVVVAIERKFSISVIRSDDMVNNYVRSDHILREIPESGTSNWLCGLMKRLVEGILKGDFFISFGFAFDVRDRTFLAGEIRRRTRGRKFFFLSFHFILAAEKDNVSCLDFCGVSFVSFPVLPTSCPQLSLEIDLFSLGEILLAKFSEFSPSYDTMPFHPDITFVCAWIEVPLIGGERKAGNCSL